VQLTRDVNLQTIVNAIIAKAKEIAEVTVVCEFSDVFPDDLLGLPPDRDVEFKIELILGTALISKRPYSVTP
jgi:hypothetical protein